jgi:hypothetical protein
MATWPSRLKPIVNQGYTFNAPNNVLTIDTLGGAPLQVLDYKYGPVEISISIVGGRLEKMVFSDFYFGKINSGADKFIFEELDTGLGLESHICQIVPGSLQFNMAGDPITIISMTIRAEKTPAQDAPFEGNLVDLYDYYGDDMVPLLESLGVFSTETLDTYFGV